MVFCVANILRGDPCNEPKEGICVFKNGIRLSDCWKEGGPLKIALLEWAYIYVYERLTIFYSISSHYNLNCLYMALRT